MSKPKRARGAKANVREKIVRSRRRLARNRAPRFNPEGTYTLHVPRGFQPRSGTRETTSGGFRSFSWIN